MDAALQLEAERLFGAGVNLRATLRSRPEGEPVVEAPAPTATVPGMRPSPPPIEGTRLTSRQQRLLWARVRDIDNFWESLAEVEPGAVSRLADAALTHGWEIVFLTQRPASEGRTAQLQSQRWLRAHGFDLPSVYVVSGSRGRIATALALDAVIDDRPENCLDVVTDSSAAAFLVWRDGQDLAPAGASRLGIQVVASIADVVGHLELAQAREPGLLSRIRGTLGI